MKVFISWSGELSKKIAQVFNEWLPQVIQSVDTFFSPDIQKGKRWQEILSVELEKCSFGVIFLTPNNLHEDWILFESGALSKIVKESNVATFLVNLKPTDVKEPLSIFQATELKKEDVLKLLNAINDNIKEGNLKENVLTKVFDKWWPDFESKVNDLLKYKLTEKPESTLRKPEELIEEVLQIVRGIQYDISKFSVRKIELEESPGRSLLQKLLEQPIPSHVDTFKSMQKYLELSDEDRQKMREDTEKFLGNTEESKRKSFDILKKILRDEDRGTDSK